MPTPPPPSAPRRPHPAVAACAGLYLAALGLGHWITPATASGDELFAAMLLIGPWLPVVLSWSAFVAVWAAAHPSGREPRVVARWRAVLRARTRAQWLLLALVATVTLPLWGLPVYGVAIAAPAGALATLGMGLIVGIWAGPTGLVAVLGAVAPWVLRALWRRRRR